MCVTTCKKKIPYLHHALVDVQHLGKHGLRVARQVDRVEAVKHLANHVLAPVVGRVDQHGLDAKGTCTLVDKPLFGVAGADKQHHRAVEEGLAGGLPLGAACSGEGGVLGTLCDAEGGLGGNRGGGCMHADAQGTSGEICCRYPGGGDKEGWNAAPLGTRTRLWDVLDVSRRAAGRTVPGAVATSACCLWRTSVGAEADAAIALYGTQ